MATNFNPYSNNIYMQEMQSMKDRIDRQMQQYQQSQNQLMQQQQQQPQIQQTFQLSSLAQNTNDFDGKYAETIEDVKNTLVYKNSLFLTKDMSRLWFKDTGGNIRVFSLQEEIQTNENIVQINSLKKEFDDFKTFIVQQLQAQKPKQEEPQGEVLAKIEPKNKFERKNK